MGLFSRIAGWLRKSKSNEAEDTPQTSDPYRSNEATEEHLRWQQEAIQTFSKKRSKELLAALIQQDVSEAILFGASRHKDAKVRSLAAKNPRMAPDCLRWLSTDSHEEVRAAVAGNRNTPGDALLLLATHKNLVYSLAVNPNAPEELLSQLAQKNDAVLHRSLLQNPNLPMPVLDQFSRSNDPSISRSAGRSQALRQHQLARVSSPDATAEELARIATSPSYEVRREVALHRNCSHQTLRTLAQDSHTPVRVTVAKNPETPADVLQRLSQDRSPAVRETILLHSNTPEEAIRAVYDKARNPSRAFQLALLANPNVPIDILQEYVTSRVESYRLLVAKHPKTTREQLDALREDRSARVKKVVQERS